MGAAQVQIYVRMLIATALVIIVVWVGAFTIQDNRAVALPGLSILVRTPPHLKNPQHINRLVNQFVSQGVRRVWVQVKQDESDEFVAGSVFYPSKIAPVASSYEDDRLQRFIRVLDANGIVVMAWMPVLHDRRAGEMNPLWRSEWIAEDGSLKIQQDWLCPNHPEVAQYEASLAQEVVEIFPELSGIYLDFIRYDDDFACACSACLADLMQRTQWQARMGRALEPMDLRHAANANSEVWQAWVEMRAEKIVTVIDTIHNAVEKKRPGFHIGAFVLPFSSTHYQFNTQAGQDLQRMARSGLDEIVLMGYWDDWDLSPSWVRDSLEAASELVKDEAKLNIVLDGDMGVRRTRLTLQNVDEWAGQVAWFHYDLWSNREFNRLRRAIEGFAQEGAVAKQENISVAIRIDTAPESQHSDINTHAEMIERILYLFAEEDIKATFVTTAKFAETQTEVLLKAAAKGHEIASHGYDNEQLDTLATEQQITLIDHSLATLQRLGFQIYGFAAPRNNITDEARDQLMAWNLEYDGSVSYDPLDSLLDVYYAPHSEGKDIRILVLPYISPYDRNARYGEGMSANKMLVAWKKRLNRVIELGEPTIVLDIHQQAASQPDYLATLRAFIRYAKNCQECRIVTMREAARHARDVLDRYELPAATSGDAKFP